MDRRQSQSEDELIAGLCRNTGDGGMSERTRKVLLDAIKMYLMSRERHNTSNVFSYRGALDPLADADEDTVSSANPTDAKTQGAQTERKDDMELLRKKLYKRYKEIQEVMDHKDRRIGPTYIYTTTNAKKVKVVFLKEVTYWIGVIDRLIRYYTPGFMFNMFNNDEKLKRLNIVKDSLQYIKQSIKEVRRHRQTQVPPVYMENDKGINLNETFFLEKPMVSDKKYEPIFGTTTSNERPRETPVEDPLETVKRWVSKWETAFRTVPRPVYSEEPHESLKFNISDSKELELSWLEVQQVYSLIEQLEKRLTRHYAKLELIMCKDYLQRLGEYFDDRREEKEKQREKIRQRKKTV